MIAAKMRLDMRPASVRPKLFAKHNGLKIVSLRMKWGTPADDLPESGAGGIRNVFGGTIEPGVYFLDSRPDVPAKPLDFAEDGSI